jgi:hypothetical protein
LPFPRRIFLFDISQQQQRTGILFWLALAATCAFLSIKPGLDSRSHRIYVEKGFCLRRRRRQSKTKGDTGAKIDAAQVRRECERSPRDVNAVTHAGKRAARQIKGANFRFSTFKRDALSSFRADIFHGRRLRDESERFCLSLTQRLVKKARRKHAAVAEDTFSLSAPQY